MAGLHSSSQLRYISVGFGRERSSWLHQRILRFFPLHIVIALVIITTILRTLIVIAIISSPAVSSQSFLLTQGDRIWPNRLVNGQTRVWSCVHSAVRSQSSRSWQDNQSPAASDITWVTFTLDVEPVPNHQTRGHPQVEYRQNAPRTVGVSNITLWCWKSHVLNLWILSMWSVLDIAKECKLKGPVQGPSKLVAGASNCFSSQQYGCNYWMGCGIQATAQQSFLSVGYAPCAWIFHYLFSDWGTACNFLGSQIIFEAKPCQERIGIPWCMLACVLPVWKPSLCIRDLGTAPPKRGSGLGHQLFREPFVDAPVRVRRYLLGRFSMSKLPEGRSKETRGNSLTFQEIVSEHFRGLTIWLTIIIITYYYYYY